MYLVVVVVVAAAAVAASCSGLSSCRLLIETPCHTERAMPRRSMASSVLLELPPGLSEARGYKADLVHLSEYGDFGREQLGFGWASAGKIWGWSWAMSPLFRKPK